MKNRCSLLTILAVLIACSVSGQTPRIQEATLDAPSATLGEVKGDVAVRSPEGVSSPARKGQVIPAESTIQTQKGSAILSLQDGSQVLVKSNTRVVLKSPNKQEGTFFELLIGKVLAQIQKRIGNAPSFKMGTPSAVITVRGTRFTVEVTKKRQTIVDVYEGLVDVTGLAMTGSPVQLSPGYWTEVEQDQVPQEPHRGNRYDKNGESPAANHRRDDDRSFTPGMVHSSGGQSPGNPTSDGDYRRQSGQQGDGTTSSPLPSSEPQSSVDNEEN